MKKSKSSIPRLEAIFPETFEDFEIAGPEVPVPAESRVAMTVGKTNDGILLPAKPIFVYLF